MRSNRSRLGAVLATVLLVGCALQTHTVSLQDTSTAPPASVTTGSPLVAIGQFTDTRGEPTYWIGAVRSPLGNPIHTLEGTAPVGQMVADAFEDGLRARGLFADPSGGAYVLSGTIKDLRGNRLVRSEARVEIQVVLTERQTLRQLFAKTYRAVDEKPGAVTPGTDSAAGVEELRGMIVRTLRQVVDQALDDPTFRDALRPA